MVCFGMLGTCLWCPGKSQGHALSSMILCLACQDFSTWFRLGICLWFQWQNFRKAPSSRKKASSFWKVKIPVAPRMSTASYRARRGDGSFVTFVIDLEGSKTWNVMSQKSNHRAIYFSNMSLAEIFSPLQSSRTQKGRRWSAKWRAISWLFFDEACWDFSSCLLTWCSWFRILWLCRMHKKLAWAKRRQPFSPFTWCFQVAQGASLGRGGIGSLKVSSSSSTTCHDPHAIFKCKSDWRWLLQSVLPSIYYPTNTRWVHCSKWCLQSVLDHAYRQTHAHNSVYCWKTDAWNWARDVSRRKKGGGPSDLELLLITNEIACL